MSERGTSPPPSPDAAPGGRGGKRRRGDDAELASPADDETRHAVDRALALHGAEEGGLLVVLHAIQDTLGYLPPAHVDTIARALNLSRAEVHGVISFYHDFRTSPPGRHVVKVCRAEACQAVGGAALAASISQRLGVDVGETRADGEVSLDAVYCLGNCACAPAIVVDGKMIGRVNEARLDGVLAGIVSKPVDTSGNGGREG